MSGIVDSLKNKVSNTFSGLLTQVDKRPLVWSIGAVALGILLVSLPTFAPSLGSLSMPMMVGGAVIGGLGLAVGLTTLFSRNSKVGKVMELVRAAVLPVLYLGALACFFSMGIHQYYFFTLAVFGAGGVFVVLNYSRETFQRRSIESRKEKTKRLQEAQAQIQQANKANAISNK